MAAKKSAESSPLTFDLKADLIGVLDKYQSKLRGVSKSEIIRHAISAFDYTGFKPQTESHRQISVRLPLKQKNSLVKLAKGKKVSIGELLRAALESLPANPARAGIEAPKPAAKKKAPAKKAAKKKVAKKKAAKKAAKKKPAKKAAKKAVKKAAKKVARKAVKRKAAPKKAAKKKAAPKKAAKRKAAPKKAAKKKAAPKKAAKRAPAKKKAAAKKKKK